MSASTTTKDIEKMSDLIELNVTQDDKESLRCVYCKGYLSSSPIRILPDGNNVCVHCDINPNVHSYRNKTLETILRNAVFPCKYHMNGCFESVRFSQTSEHENSCQFHQSYVTTMNGPGITNHASNMDVVEIIDEEPVSKTNSENPVSTAPSSSHSTAEQTIPKVLKSSDSVCEQPNSTGVETKVETASISQAEATTCNDTSVCSDATSTRWNGEARMNARQSTNNSHSNRNRSRSVSSNRANNYWTRDRGYYHYHANQPYHLDWRYDNMYHRQDEFRPEHVMFKRRNNVIIIKGGTFYVNW